MWQYVSFFPSGLDYVSHEDILPYNSTEQAPIQHELFERFLMYNPAKCKHPSTVPSSTFSIVHNANFFQLPELIFSFYHSECIVKTFNQIIITKIVYRSSCMQLMQV